MLRIRSMWCYFTLQGPKQTSFPRPLGVRGRAQALDYHLDLESIQPGHVSELRNTLITECKHNQREINFLFFKSQDNTDSWIPEISYNKIAPVWVTNRKSNLTCMPVHTCEVFVPFSWDVCIKTLLKHFNST